MRVAVAGALIGIGLGLGACAELPETATPPQLAASGPASGGLAGLFERKPAADDRARSIALKPLEQASLLGGDVVVAGPPGYCVDQRTLTSRGGRGFAMIASCNILSRGQTGDIVAPAVVTVTAGGRGAVQDLPSPETIAAELGAPLIGRYDRDGVRLAHLATGGDALFPDGDPRHWRGAFVQGDRIVGLALYAPKGHPILSGDSGGTLLRAVRARIAALSKGSSDQDASTETR
ncbi:dihydroxy-acid dehydratase [Thalassococcus sp. CAU 1522]|uniref:Dihydroxy-acid dehydratase n=1 Tax=Thalassococcus arenae TaxID=2851652 RepID=A0ABS6N6A5_9RHOB|nr:dihydroxy-acid dehydratase [Thalassococcus arenae]MBV2359192.1 dihydroxy-acid dehydratase [Thalassococcus arenae]